MGTGTVAHFTLKQNPLTRAHLGDFVQCYRPDEDRSKRVETERFKAYTYEELVARDKANLDITWLRGPSLDDPENLPAPEVLAAEIVEDLQAALEEFAAIAETLQQARGVGLGGGGSGPVLRLTRTRGPDPCIRARATCVGYVTALTRTAGKRSRWWV
ncbi:MAG TPA: hypothetical protein VKZ89_14025 [Thermobifida alba]|nr:hypothetical protein [Thermobifida alba]